MLQQLVAAPPHPTLSPRMPVHFNWSISPDAINPPAFLYQPQRPGISNPGSAGHAELGTPRHQGQHGCSWVAKHRNFPKHGQLSTRMANIPPPNAQKEATLPANRCEVRLLCTLRSVHKAPPHPRAAHVESAPPGSRWPAPFPRGPSRQQGGGPPPDAAAHSTAGGRVWGSKSHGSHQ